MKTHKECKDCGEIKSRTEFPLLGKYHGARCEICYPIYTKAKYDKYHADNKDKINQKQRDGYIKHKQLVFAHYGNCCKCCGENEILFLTVDHINNDGNLHRKNSKDTSHHNIYAWIVRNDYPDTFQILCMNCNQGKHRNKGVCPHVSKKSNGHLEREYSQAAGSGTSP